MSAVPPLKEAYERLRVATEAGFPPRTVIRLIAECVLATAHEQMDSGDELALLAQDVQDKLGKIVEQMERLNVGVR